MWKQISGSGLTFCFETAAQPTAGMENVTVMSKVTGGACDRADVEARGAPGGTAGTPGGRGACHGGRAGGSMGTRCCSAALLSALDKPGGLWWMLWIRRRLGVNAAFGLAQGCPWEESEVGDCQQVRF